MSMYLATKYLARSKTRATVLQVGTGDVFAASAINQTAVTQSNTQALVLLALQANTATITQVAVAANNDNDTVIA